MDDSKDQPELDTLDYKPSGVTKTGGVIANPEQPKEPICSRCQKMNCQCRKVLLKEQNQAQQLIIIEQATGAAKVVLQLLKQITPYNTDQREYTQGCICTVEWWLNHKLKHLKEAFE